MKLVKALLLALICAAAGGALAQDGTGHGGKGPPKAPATAPAKSAPPASAPAPKAPKPRNSAAH